MNFKKRQRIRADEDPEEVFRKMEKLGVNKEVIEKIKKSLPDDEEKDE